MSRGAYLKPDDHHVGFVRDVQFVILRQCTRYASGDMRLSRSRFLKRNRREVCNLSNQAFLRPVIFCCRLKQCHLLLIPKRMSIRNSHPIIYFVEVFSLREKNRSKTSSRPRGDRETKATDEPWQIQKKNTSTPLTDQSSDLRRRANI